MAESFTSYSVDNDKRFRDAIKRASEACDDLRIPFGLILADFYRSEQAIFKLKSAGQYPDYKSGGAESKYAQAKQKRRGFKYPLLVDSGALAASLLKKDAPGAVASVGPASLIFGTQIHYGLYHQSDRPRSKIPLRKFLFIGPEAPQFATSEQQGRPERWMNILNDYTLKQLKNTGAFSG